MSTQTLEKSTRLACEGGTPVRTEPLPWELPGAHWIGDEELELVSRVIRAKSPFRYYGLDAQHIADKLEAAFREKFGYPHVLAVNSGTAALHISLAAMEIGPGCEVLLPGYLWTSCISAVVRLGAIPRLVDIDDTFGLDPEDLKRKIGPKSKAVLYVHMNGVPGRIQEVAEIARRSGLKLLEDCAQAAGASSQGTPVGSFGDMAIYSFQLNKNMTSGDGGLVVCKDPHLAKRAFAVHDLGYARNEQGRLDPSDERYQLWGIGSRMSELTAAFALAQLGKLDRITGAMRSSKWKIRKALEGIPGLEFRNILDPKGDSSPYMITLYRTPEVCQRFTKALQAEGISGVPGSFVCLSMKDFGLHWYFNNQSLVHRRSLSPDGFPWTHPANAFASGYRYDRGQLPRCDEYEGRGALLSIASCLKEKDEADIITAFRKVAGVVLGG